MIARFSNETLYGKSVLLENENLLEKQASDILMTYLAQSEKFILFEKSNTAPILAALDKGDLTSIGLPADYLLIGSITEFGRENLGKTGVFSQTKEQKAYAKVNIRLVDVKTAQVVFAKDARGEAVTETGTVMGVGTRAGYDSTLNDKAISAAIGKLVGNIVESLLERPWRSYILKVEGSKIWISGGATQGLGVGNKLAIKLRGEEISNPQTGLITELPAKKIGEIEIKALHGKTPENEIAECTGSIEVAEQDIAKYIIEEE